MDETAQSYASNTHANSAQFEMAAGRWAATRDPVVYDVPPMAQKLLDQSSHGLLVVMPCMTVLLANKVARELMQRGDGIKLSRQRLVCADIRSYDRLTLLMRRLCAQQDERHTTALRVRNVSGRPDLQLQLNTQFTIDHITSPVVCVRVYEPHAHRSLDRVLLSDLCGLTSAEMDVTEAFRQKSFVMDGDTNCASFMHAQFVDQQGVLSGAGRLLF